jgi:hypothetical protein
VTKVDTCFFDSHRVIGNTSGKRYGLIKMKNEVTESPAEYQPFIDQFESKIAKDVQKAVSAIRKRANDLKV